MESIKQNPLVKKVGFNRIVLCIVLLLNLKCLELRILPGIFIAGSYIRNRNGRN